MTLRTMKLAATTRVAADLIAFRPGSAVLSSGALRRGQLLKVGDAHAAVLCERSGTVMAGLLSSGPSGSPPPVLQSGEEAVLLSGQSLCSALALDPVHLGGLVLDPFGVPLGKPLSGAGRSLDAAVSDRALFGEPPGQSDLKPICQSLHTGVAALDALTPIGRGQSMLFLGKHATP